jgi:hypothetical protein
LFLLIFICSLSVAETGGAKKGARNTGAAIGRTIGMKSRKAFTTTGETFKQFGIWSGETGKKIFIRQGKFWKKIGRSFTPWNSAP